MKFQFVNQKMVSRRTAFELDEIRRRQLAVAGASEIGGEFDSLEELFEEMEAQEYFEALTGDDGMDEELFEHWEIADAENPGKPVFEMWFFNGTDDGEVFFANTDQSTGISMIQGGFDYVEETKETEAIADGAELADAIQEAFFQKNAV